MLDTSTSIVFKCIVELRALCKKELEKDPCYQIDEIISQYGHSILRLPPYHPGFKILIMFI